MDLPRYQPFIPTEYDTFDTLVINELSKFPLDNLFNMYINEIRQHSTTIDFNASRYDYRPDLVSWDHYQSLNMTNLILLVNRCTTLMNFTRANIGATILVPDKNYLVKLLNSEIIY